VASATEPNARVFELQDLTDVQVVSRSGSSDRPPTSSASQSVTVRNIVDRFSALMTPLAVATAFLAPAPPAATRRIRSLSSTVVGRHWFDLVWDEDEWRYAPELISPKQAEALHELLSLPLVPDVSFHFREHE